MKGHRPTAALALAALLVVAGCAGVPSETGASGAGEPGTITVGASGDVSAQPDQAVVNLEVVTTGQDVQTVRQRLAENATAMREALVESGINETRITTDHYNIREDRIERRESGRTVYRGVHAFSVTVTDVDAVGDTVDAAVENGANNVGGIQFTLSEERRRSLHNDALREAMSNARSQADVIAERADLSISGVADARTVRTGYTPYRAESAEFSGAGGDAGTSVSSGPVTVNAQVEVTYNATG